mgnify:CR=1 FL=1
MKKCLQIVIRNSKIVNLLTYMRIIITILIIFYSLIQGYTQQTVGLFSNDSTSYNGYTLIAPLLSNEVYLIDNCGEMVNEWTSSTYRPAASVYLLEDGSLLKTCNPQTGKFVVGGTGGRLEKYDWNDNLTWSFDYASETFQLHHDIALLPNGNILALAFDLLDSAEAYNIGLDTSLYFGDFWSEKVVELQPVGIDSAIIVWEWRLKDHFVQDIDANRSNFGNVKNNRQLVNLNYSGNSYFGDDWFHANSLAYNEDLDQIVISTRNFSEFWIIDHSTTTQEAQGHTGGNSGMGGDILYRWGNPDTYNTGTQTDRKLYGQHDVHWIPANYREGGKIIVFNNGFNDPDEISKVHTINPPIDSNGNYSFTPSMVNEPFDFDWTYKLPLFVDFISGVNRLPNGNTLICSGPNGRVFELDSMENIVWEYINPVGNNNIASQGDMPSQNLLFRAYRYGTDYPAFDGRTLTPQAPLELNPWTSNCTIHWFTDVEDIPKNIEANILGNPFNHQLRLENNTNKVLNIKIVDALGRNVTSFQTSDILSTVQTQNWADGMYLVIMQMEGQSTIQTHKVLKLSH